MSTPTEQYRIWTISYMDRTPPKMERVEARFISFGANSRQIFLEAKNKQRFLSNPMCDWLCEEDREFLNRLFECVEYRLDSSELPKALEKDEGAPIGVFGNQLINLDLAENVLLSDGVLTDVELSQLQRMPNLESLHFCANRIQTDQSLEILAKWDKPTKLYFTLSNITANGMKAISQMKHLHTLYFEESHQITDAGLAYLGELGNLKSLTIKRCRSLNDHHWEFIERLTQLEDIYLFQFHISDELLKKLGKFASLQRIDLARCGEDSLSDEGLLQLKHLKRLTHLILSGFPNITDKGLAGLQNAENLVVLEIKSCPEITDAGFAPFEQLTQLEKFEFAFSPSITGAGLKYLRNCQKLRELSLFDCSNIVDESLDFLAPFEQLEDLCLGDCVRITDAALEKLHTLKKLKILNIFDCRQITQQSVKRLKTILPDLEIFGPKTRSEDLADKMIDDTQIQIKFVRGTTRRRNDLVLKVPGSHRVGRLPALASVHAVGMSFGREIFESVPERVQPGWAAMILSLFYDVLDHIPEVVSELIAICEVPERWNEAYDQFSKIRCFGLEYPDAAPKNFFYLAEKVAKITFNATHPLAYFDKNSGWKIPKFTILTAREKDDRWEHVFVQGLLLFIRTEQLKKLADTPERFALWRHIDEVLYNDWDPQKIRALPGFRSNYYDTTNDIFIDAVSGKNVQKIAEHLEIYETLFMNFAQARKDLCLETAKKIADYPRI